MEVRDALIIAALVRRLGGRVSLSEAEIAPHPRTVLRVDPSDVTLGAVLLSVEPLREVAPRTRPAQAGVPAHGGPRA